VRQIDAWVLTIGDELLRGEIVDSNKSFFSERLLRLDIETTRHVTVADDPEPISEQLRAATSDGARIVLISGGLGPTRDDITTEVVARTFSLPLERDQATVDRMRSYFASVGREMSENNAKQADFPKGAEILANPLGTAPGFMLRIEDCLIFCTPGVPRELYRMVDQEILPRIAEERAANGAAARPVRAQLLRTFGLGESTLDQELSDIAQGDPNLTLGFRTQFPDNLVRVVARGDVPAEAESKLRHAVDAIRDRLGATLIAESDQTLEATVGELLLQHELRIAVAESCTGGLLSHLLTENPGSSKYLLESIVCYSNASKMRELGVSAEVLRKDGAVSEQVALQLATAMRSRTGADLGIAVTGIAGPDSDEHDTPIGTLWIALATSTGTRARQYQLTRDRGRNKRLAAQIALEWIRRTVIGLELPDETFPRLRSAAFDPAKPSSSHPARSEQRT